MKAVICLAAFLTATPLAAARADGAFSVGILPNGHRVFAIIANTETFFAPIVGETACEKVGGTHCQVPRVFQDSCLGFAFDQEHIEFYEGDTPSAADAALTQCNDLHHDCRRGFAICDDRGKAVGGTETEDELKAETTSQIAVPTTGGPSQTPQVAPAVQQSNPMVFLLPAALAFVILSGLWMQRTASKPSQLDPSATTTLATPPITEVVASPPPHGEDARSPTCELELPIDANALLPVLIERDTPGALVAMEVALAFIDEVRRAAPPALDDKDGRRDRLNTLALASRQLEQAETLDQDAILAGVAEDGVPYRYTLNELKAEALFQEGVTHRYCDTRRAIPPLEAAARLDPHNATTLFTLGIIQAANRNKAEAVAALEKALVLAPKDIQIRKELIRAQAMTGAEIATYKATRAGERVYDAGIATANAGIKTWNVFAMTWNVVTFPIRLPLRLGAKLFNVMSYIIYGR